MILMRIALQGSPQSKVAYACYFYMGGSGRILVSLLDELMARRYVIHPRYAERSYQAICLGAAGVGHRMEGSLHLSRFERKRLAFEGPYYAGAQLSIEQSPVPLRGQHVFSGHEWQFIASHLDLSPRELQIVGGIFDDKKELTIAAELGISSNTVHTHLSRLYHKLGVTSRVDLVVHFFAEHVAEHVAKHAGTNSGPLPSTADL